MRTSFLGVAQFKLHRGRRRSSDALTVTQGAGVFPSVYRKLSQPQVEESETSVRVLLSSNKVDYCLGLSFPGQ